MGIGRAAVDGRGVRALATLLEEQLRAAGELDGLVLSLHGAMCAEGTEAADAALVACAREVLGPDVTIGVCLDLHANVTEALLAGADFVIGYRTYPHVDQAETGRRTARARAGHARRPRAPGLGAGEAAAR